MTIINDLYNVKRELIAKAGTEVTLVADHMNVLIVADAKGNKFSVNINNIKERKVIPSPNIDGSQMKKEDTSCNQISLIKCFNESKPGEC